MTCAGSTDPGAAVSDHDAHCRTRIAEGYKGTQYSTHVHMQFVTRRPFLAHGLARRTFIARSSHFGHLTSVLRLALTAHAVHTLAAALAVGSTRTS